MTASNRQNQRIIVALFFAFLIPFADLQGQSEAKKKDNTNFISLGTASCLVIFRDQATSPLFYAGFGQQLDIGHTHSGPVHHYQFTLGFLAGFTLGGVGNEIATSTVFSPQAYVHYTRRIAQIDDNIQWQMGGAIDNRLLIRNNPALMNAGFGFDNIATLFFANRFEMDISRKKPFIIDNYFFKITLPERKRRVFVQMNLAVLNTAYRNSYAYIIDGPDFPDFSPLSGHTFSLNGFRMQCLAGFEQFLKNGNGFSLYYGWDMFTQVGKFEPLDFAQHRLGLVLHFKTR